VLPETSANMTVNLRCVALIGWQRPEVKNLLEQDYMLSQQHYALCL
jgi:hypothetical protein